MTIKLLKNLKVEANMLTRKRIKFRLASMLRKAAYTIKELQYDNERLRRELLEYKQEEENKK